MMNIDGFDTNDPYYDNKHFRIGFHRCGEFTISQADILQTYGRTLIELEQGVRDPVTQQEKNFVAVCREEREPETQLENTWQKYRALTTKKNTIKAFGCNSIQPDTSDINDDSLDNEDIVDIKEL